MEKGNCTCTAFVPCDACPREPSNKAIDSLLLSGADDELPDIDSWIYDDVKGGYMTQKPICDCGVKFTGGRHSDWCKGRAGQIQSEPDNETLSRVSKESK